MNLVSLTLTVAFVSAVYVAWIYVPLWLDDLDVREALASGGSQLMSETAGMSGPAVQKMVANRLSTVGYHWEEQDGRQVQVPGLGVAADDVQVERAPDGKSGRLTLDYERTVKLKPLERYLSVRFHTSREVNYKP